MCRCISSWARSTCRVTRCTSTSSWLTRTSSPCITSALELTFQWIWRGETCKITSCTFDQWTLSAWRRKETTAFKNGAKTWMQITTCSKLTNNYTIMIALKVHEQVLWTKHPALCQPQRPWREESDWIRPKHQWHVFKSSGIKQLSN